MSGVSYDKIRLSVTHRSYQIKLLIRQFVCPQTKSKAPGFHKLTKGLKLDGIVSDIIDNNYMHIVYKISTSFCNPFK